MTIPLRLTVEGFVEILRRTGVPVCAETVRRRIRAGDVEAHGRPYAIPRRELEKFGLAIDEVEKVLR